VLGVRPDEIRSYVAGLTPVLLRADTRVTNHGYRDGVATPRQSVLQAGTAVLVDGFGVPRVRCSCGNPLTEPAPLSSSLDAATSNGRVVLVGERWAGWDPTTVLVVNAVDEFDQIVLFDIDTNLSFTTPVGTDVEASADAGPLRDGRYDLTGTEVCRARRERSPLTAAFLEVDGDRLRLRGLPYSTTSDPEPWFPFVVDGPSFRSQIEFPAGWPDIDAELTGTSTDGGETFSATVFSATCQLELSGRHEQAAGSNEPGLSDPLAVARALYDPDNSTGQGPCFGDYMGCPITPELRRALNDWSVDNWDVNPICRCQNSPSDPVTFTTVALPRELADESDLEVVRVEYFGPKFVLVQRQLDGTWLAADLYCGSGPDAYARRLTAGDTFGCE
jgi:hypothetical protein